MEDDDYLYERLGKFCSKCGREKCVMNGLSLRNCSYRINAMGCPIPNVNQYGCPDCDKELDKEGYEIYLRYRNRM